MPLSHTVGSSVIRNQNLSSWEFCPDQIENALSKMFFPEYTPHPLCGRDSFINDRRGQPQKLSPVFYSVASSFWNSIRSPG